MSESKIKGERLSTCTNAWDAREARDTVGGKGGRRLVAHVDDTNAVLSRTNENGGDVAAT